MKTNRKLIDVNLKLWLLTLVVMLTQISCNAQIKKETKAFEKIKQHGEDNDYYIEVKLNDEGYVYMLTLSGEGLSIIPDDIQKFKEVVSILVDETNITDLPEFIRNFKELKYLKLRNNPKLTKIPEEVFELKNLEVLDLQSNNIQSISPRIGNLTKLRRLNLWKNSAISSLPNEIGNLEKLEELWLPNTSNLTSLPSGFSNLKSLKSLTASGCGFTSFPNEILKLENLTDLSITFEDGKVPKEIDALYFLRYINFRNIKSEIQLPENIGELKHIDHFAFRNCNLENTVFPESITNWNLSWLIIKDCILYEFPEVFTRVPILGAISLENLRIKSIPENIQAWQEIGGVSIRFTQIKKLPDMIGLLPKLTSLNVEFNDLRTLPSSLQYNHNDLAIYWAGNAWEWLPQELVDNFESSKGRGLPPVNVVK